ncbi:MAG: hypothetical protein LBC52_04905 [Treponema sp.]|jgi:hypothetical protein|nr:hypothetical protein [Treponema sp.]
MPSFRLTDKEKQDDGRYKKAYEEQPRTPYRRPMESSHVSPECKAEPERRRAGQNPVELNRRLNEAVGLLLKIKREKIYLGKPPCQGDGRAPAA